MQVVINPAYVNRIELQLGSFIGPLVQDGIYGLFDPRRDLDVYIDGALTPIQFAAYDGVNNRYLLYTAQAFNPTSSTVVQVIHHMPDPPFQYIERYL